MAFEHRAFEGQLLRPLGSYAQPLGGGGCWDCDVLTVTGFSAWMEESFKGEFKTPDPVARGPQGPPGWQLLGL